MKRGLHQAAIAVGLVALAAAIFGLLLVLLGPAAWRLGGRTLAELQGKERADAINSARQTLLAAAAGTAALTGLLFTARTYYLSRRGQLTDRYARAITQLASDKLTERLGGVYALEHLMAESPRDQGTVVEVLAAFIRESAPAPAAESTPEAPPVLGRRLTAFIRKSAPTPAVEPTPLTMPNVGSSRDPKRRPATDVQAALTVLGRRPDRPEANPLNLSRTDLRGAQLERARLQGADLRKAHLQYANLRAAQLEDADLSETQLQGIDLCEAQLMRASLPVMQLQRVDQIDELHRSPLPPELVHHAEQVHPAPQESVPATQ